MIIFFIDGIVAIATGFLYTRFYLVPLPNISLLQTICQSIVRIFCAVFFLFRLLNSTAAGSILMGTLVGIAVIFTQKLSRP